MSEKKQIKELKQVDGRKNYQTMEQVWGETGIGKYKTLDVSEYEDQLNQMNKTDLESHARSLGLISLDDTKRLKHNLIGEFKSYVRIFNPLPTIREANRPITADIKKILDEGR